MLLTHLHNNYCLTVLIWRELIALFQSMALNGMGILLEPLNGISLFRGNSVALRCKNPSITSVSSLLTVLSCVYICVRYVCVRKAVWVRANLCEFVARDIFIQDGQIAYPKCRLQTELRCLFYRCSTLKDT